MVLFLSLLFGVSALCFGLLFNDYSQTNFLNSYLHLLSRGHPFFVHFGISFLLVYYLCLFKFPNESQRVGLFTFLLFNISYWLGALMQIIENYPNPFIANHYQRAFLFLLSLYAMLFFHQGLSKKKKVKVVFVLINLCLLFLAAHKGGVIRKGEGFLF